MDKRYQVFVSSTFADLKEERQAIMQALLSLDHFPAGMELFPATNEDQWTLIKGVIDDSDYYVIVIGGRYGSTTDEGVSFTEKEFDYAIEKKKPVLAFVHAKPEEIAAGKTDQNDSLRERLALFKAKIMKNRLVKLWSSTMELQSAVLQSIVTETKRNPQEGWVRVGQAADPEALRALQEEKAALQDQLHQLSSTSPAGSEELCGGDDVYEFSVRYHRTWSASLEFHEVSLSWDTIFREIGPLLLHEATESAMRSRLVGEALQYLDTAGKKPSVVQSSEILNEDFDTIKVQLFALGLIRRGVAKRAIADKGTYWGLTPYGEAHLMRLRALRKDDEDETDDGDG